MQAFQLFGISKLNENNTSIFVENSTEKLGIGSGIILSSNGYILSNYSLTGGVKSTCYATLKNGNVYPAEVMWADENLDISIIKIPAENLLYLFLGDSNKISFGQEVYCLSNWTGYDFTRKIDIGVISKINTTLKLGEVDNLNYVEDVINLSTTINTENSGRCSFK